MQMRQGEKIFIYQINTKRTLEEPSVWVITMFISWQILDNTKKIAK